jgi:hypothetical protein
VMTGGGDQGRGMGVPKWPGEATNKCPSLNFHRISKSELEPEFKIQKIHLPGLQKP